MKPTLCSTLIAGLFVVASHASATVPSGVDTAAIDPAVRAQDDFFRHSQGKWLKDVEIPSDRASWGAFNVAQDNVEGQIRSLIDGAAQDKHVKAGSDEQKMGDFYASYVDETKRNALGLAPLKTEIARIDALRDKRGLAALVAQLSRIGVGTPVDMNIHQDNKASTRYIVDLSQSGLGMPNRDYYLQADDAKLAAIRAKYQVHVEKCWRWPATRMPPAWPPASLHWKLSWPGSSGAPWKTAIPSRRTTSSARRN